MVNISFSTKLDSEVNTEILVKKGWIGIGISTFIAFSIYSTNLTVILREEARIRSLKEA
jgi:hypothetical protein